MTFLAALATAGLLLSSPQEGVVAAQPQVPSSDLGTIVVEGRAIEDQVESFVEDVAAPPRGRGLARWDSEVCVGAANMQARYAQYMIDRVATVAADLGLEIGEPGCRANILIIASDDASALATRLADENPSGFRPSRNNTDMGSEALERFKSTDAPVRWWYVSLPVSADTGELAVRLDHEEPPQIRVRDASRLRANIRDDLSRVMIILDVAEIGRIPYRALSDYVAMVALAQIAPDADPSDFDSILNLFGTNEGLRRDELTNWDRDYLTSLYTVSRDRARDTQQTRAVAQEMIESRREREAGDEDSNPSEAP